MAERPRSTAAALAALAATVLLGAGATAPASASGDDVKRSGRCSGATTWKLKAGPEDGRIEVEAEVDSNRVGQRWRWTLRHDGTTSARGTGRTRGPSGSFEVRRTMTDLNGADTVVLRARNARTGEVCRGRLVF